MGENWGSWSTWTLGSIVAMGDLGGMFFAPAMRVVHLNMTSWVRKFLDLAIPLLGIHTEETRIERDTCTSMFIAALFIIARTWNQPRCPSADELIRKLWYVYTMDHYSTIKKNTFESVLMRWMKLEPIIQSEVSQKEKHQYSILTYGFFLWSCMNVRVGL